jgi:hypothetical protein
MAGIGRLAACISAAGAAVFWHRAWSAIQDGYARTTPGRAIGLMLVPFFNIYWLFQLVGGLAEDYNAYLERHALPGEPLPEGLYKLYCWLSLTHWIPYLGVITSLVDMVLMGVIISKTCDAVNALPERVTEPVLA